MAHGIFRRPGSKTYHYYDDCPHFKQSMKGREGAFVAHDIPAKKAKDCMVCHVRRRREVEGQ